MKDSSSVLNPAFFVLVFSLSIPTFYAKACPGQEAQAQPQKTTTETKVNRSPAIEEDSIRVESAASQRQEPKKEAVNPPSLIPFIGEDDQGL